MSKQEHRNDGQQDSEYERRMNDESIRFFRSLIEFKQQNGKPTRLANFAGHVGRHMSQYVGHKAKQWFVQHYPNVSDYHKFFRRNERHFAFDSLSGEIRIASHVSPYARPTYLSALMAIAFKRETSLQQLSNNLHEFQCFRQSFGLVKTHIENNQIKSLPIEALVKGLTDADNDKNFRLVVDVIRNLRKSTESLDQLLVKYLCEHYPTVFTHYREESGIGFTQSITENLVKASTDIDETIDDWLKHLITKYLLKFGNKDVTQLKDDLAKRHRYLIDYLFKGEDYTLFDFVLSNREDFTYRRVSDSQSVLRVIGVKSAYNEVKDEKGVDNEETRPVDERNSNNGEINGNALSECCVCCPLSCRSQQSMSLSDYRQFAPFHAICLMRLMLDE